MVPPSPYSRRGALAGRPTGDWGPLGSFENWDPIVRGAVWWATGEDCCTTRKTAAAEAPERLNKIALLEAWKALPGGGPDGPGVTIEEACEFASPTFNCSTGKTAPEPYPELRRALLRFSPDGKLPGHSDAQSHPPLAERIQDRRPGVQRLRHRQTRRQVVRHRGEDPVPALIITLQAITNTHTEHP